MRRTAMRILGVACALLGVAIMVSLGGGEAIYAGSLLVASGVMCWFIGDALEG